MQYCHESNRPNFNCNTLLLLLSVLSCAFFTGCQPEANTDIASANAKTYFPVQIEERTLQLQLALTLDEQRQGLMFRKELPENHGMLFLSERPRKQGFWMKNTSLPLDIGFFESGGRLVEVHKLFPYDESGVASRSDQILIAIETNRDWYADNNVRPGAQLDMESLRAAIIERGFSPANFAIED